MIPTNPYVLGIILAASLTYMAVNAVKTPIHNAARHVCHIATLGHKCGATKPPTK